MFKELEKMRSRPEPFEFYTADQLWTDEHTSEQMLKYHLNENIDVSSRRGSFIGPSVEWIVSHFKIDNGSKIIDFGCGPGLYTARLAKKGADVTGIDFSKRSIEYARRTAEDEGLSIEYFHKNYFDFDTDQRFDLIIMIMCDLCALAPDQRKQLLKKFRSLLKPGGSILLDVYSIPAFEMREESSTYEKNLLNGFWSKDDYHGFLNIFKYNDEKVILDKYTIIGPERTKTIYNWLQYFSPERLKEEFRNYGLEITEIFSDVAGNEFDAGSYEFAIVAKSNADDFNKQRL